MASILRVVVFKGSLGVISSEYTAMRSGSCGVDVSDRNILAMSGHERTASDSIAIGDCTGTTTVLPGFPVTPICKPIVPNSEY